MHDLWIWYINLAFIVHWYKSSLNIIDILLIKLMWVQLVIHLRIYNLQLWSYHADPICLRLCKVTNHFWSIDFSIWYIKKNKTFIWQSIANHRTTDNYLSVVIDIHIIERTALYQNYTLETNHIFYSWINDLNIGFSFLLDNPFINYHSVEGTIFELQ